MQDGKFTRRKYNSTVQLKGRCERKITFYLGKLSESTGERGMGKNACKDAVSGDFLAVGTP